MVVANLAENANTRVCHQAANENKEKVKYVVVKLLFSYILVDLLEIE